MTYTQALDFIHSTCWKGSRPGLERTIDLAARLGNPQNSLKFIHIAGTNGKGSTSAMLAAILQRAGYRVGLYTSPFIIRFNERMQINGQDIPDDELAEITEYVKPHAEAMADTPTEFELITAIALVYFARHACDYVVFEVGMGGRLDSTNIIPPRDRSRLGHHGHRHGSHRLSGRHPRKDRHGEGGNHQGGSPRGVRRESCSHYLRRSS